MAVDDERRVGENTSQGSRANTNGYATDRNRVLLDEVIRLRSELAAQRQREETLTNLASTVAHDFNNVLMAISGAVSVAGRNLDDKQKASDRLHDVRDAVRTGAAIAGQLMSLMRAQNMPSTQSLRIDDVIRQLRTLLEAVVGKNVTLLFDLNAPNAVFEIDPAHIQQILLNLVLNARDAMNEGGRIWVTTEIVPLAIRTPGMKPGPYVRLAVADEGPGVPAELREDIFRPFCTTKAGRGGTGLGLFVVRRIVDELQGGLKLIDTGGVGATFELLLPFTFGTMFSDDPTPTKVIPRGLAEASLRVLLVEDHRVVSQNLGDLLSDVGHKVSTVRTAADAEQCIARAGDSIDVIIVDALLPDGTGCHVAEVARRYAPRVNMIFMSGHSREELIARGRLDHDAVFVQKPFSEEELLRRVRRRRVR